MSTNKLFIDKEKKREEVLEFEGEKYTFVFRKLSWDENLKIQNGAISMLPDGSMDIDIKEATYQMALLALIKAPFEITRENLEQLDEDVGNWLESKLQVKSSFRKDK